ncbi:hypothetical protein ACVWZ4_004277 [Bradyrhizobium sp. USDA 4472]
MKSRVLDSEDTVLLAIANFEKSLRNDANPRMWFKRQFLVLNEHFNFTKNLNEAAMLRAR